ncbi:MFS transporter [Acinetobacter venetianus]|uniref:MFS transporter n=1 Tax=Acinetobacter venetianus TaxID=52133 RepID=UPI00102373E1|nr:MFS transporter [Acinetobacter venetianus]RZG79290.1 MFS transporter [Acinetobacter venetianus]
MSPTSAQSAFAAFISRDFRLLTLNQCCLTFAVLIQEVLVAFHLYQITKNPLMLGLVGLMDFLPFLALSLWGGYIADRFNRQRILQISFTLSIPLSLALWLSFDSFQTQHISSNVLLITTFSILFLFGCIRGIYSPCFNSLRPFIVPEHLYTNAVTWTSMCWQANGILAPVLGGLLLKHLSLNITFAVICSLFTAGSIALWCMQQRDFPQLKTESISNSLKEALQFIFKTKIIFWVMFLDLSSVFFAGIITLLPIFAQDILHIGADGFGVLRAAPAVGSLVMMAFLVRFPPQYQPWHTMLIAITGFSLCTLLFAVTRHLYFSAVVLIIMGACDSINIVIRQTILQLIPPKDMLGRVAAINGIFVTSSNELGAVQSSVMARLFSVIPAMLIGGSLSLVCVFLVKSKTKALFNFRF